jgi:GT2 family glycosyltransferase
LLFIVSYSASKHARGHRTYSSVRFAEDQHYRRIAYSFIDRSDWHSRLSVFTGAFFQSLAQVAAQRHTTVLRYRKALLALPDEIVRLRFAHLIGYCMGLPILADEPDSL